MKGRPLANASRLRLRPARGSARRGSRAFGWRRGLGWVAAGSAGLVVAWLAVSVGRIVPGGKGTEMAQAVAADRTASPPLPPAAPTKPLAPSLAADSLQGRDNFVPSRAADPRIPGALPTFARLRPEIGPRTSGPVSARVIPDTIALPSETTFVRGTDMRSIEQNLDPGLNVRALARPGEVKLSEKEAEELRRRVRPGFFSPEPYKIPFVHTDVIAPHLTPDVEVAVSDKTKVGVFGQVGAAGEAKSVSLPGLNNRPIGAGVTLEYKFGTK